MRSFFPRFLNMEARMQDRATPNLPSHDRNATSRFYTQLGFAETFRDMTRADSDLPGVFRWTLLGRAVVFALAASSIWCLLAEFYRLCSMRTFTLYVLIPASAALVIIAAVNYFKGDRRLFAAV